MTTNVIITDMHGVIFSYNKDFDCAKSIEKLKQVIKRYSESFSKYKNAFEQYIQREETLGLEIEYKSVIAYLKTHKPNELRLFEIPGAISELMRLIKNGYKVVVVTTSEERTSSLILKEFLKRHTSLKETKKLISKIDFWNIFKLGYKDKIESWRKILQNYSNIVSVYDDKSAYFPIIKEAIGLKNVKYHTSLSQKKVSD